jgi:hypothetical protein
VTPISLGIFASANTTVEAGDFQSIATVTVGSGGAANVEFTSIPSTFTHLQIRGITKKEGANDDGANYLEFQVNSDTGSNYANHWLLGNGSAVSAGSQTSNTTGRLPLYMLGYTNGTGMTTTLGGFVVDILDYKDTNKYKTIRCLAGTDTNGVATVNGQNIAIGSSLWMSTSAITSIKLFNGNTGIDLAQYSHFALYGIKGPA